MIGGDTSFIARHIGPGQKDVEAMLQALGATDLDAFIDRVVPSRIRSQKLELSLFLRPRSEAEATALLRQRADKNKIYRSFIGLGYYNTITPPVIQRTIFENPAWYTAYTPYQPEIAQGRLEALLNFQTVVTELTGLPVANASLLDEGTAAAEAAAVALAVYADAGKTEPQIFVEVGIHPHTVAVLETRMQALGVPLVSFSRLKENNFSQAAAVFFQYPDTLGVVFDATDLCAAVAKQGAMPVAICDPLALTLLKSPGAMGAAIAVGSMQRFGIPLGFGGPHPAFFAVRDDLKRLMPGRLVGVSKDAAGNPALRLSLQTREQHIRREKATSNICTSQVLLAVMASMYAVYHGPKGLTKIATEIQHRAEFLRAALQVRGVTVSPEPIFDTVHVIVDAQSFYQRKARSEAKQINLRIIDQERLTISVDEATTENDIYDLVEVLCGDRYLPDDFGSPLCSLPPSFLRKESFLQQPVFNRYASETELLRYIYRLNSKDLSLATAMIPLGSCTMKLNAASEMYPVSWPEFSKLHPFVPAEQMSGYQKMCDELEIALCEITGFAAVSLQPNAGSQGEYAGLLVIKAYHQSRGDLQRTICLIPKSAHGTNPASAVMAGFSVVAVACDDRGNIDLGDLGDKVREYGDRIGVLMVTYPSTHGVFEESIAEICTLVHGVGGQVYMDGANLNAQVGLCKPAAIGADVCHINLHKTFCIPHGGGGPGMGPIGVAPHLADFLPGHPFAHQPAEKAIGPVSSAPFSSASILPISWMYLAMMGSAGVTMASKVAILSANYIAARLAPHFPVLYKGLKGFVAHECILDLRAVKKSAGIEVDDVAKRLMDFGFHAPTVSFPVSGTMMIEPTESESKTELDRFVAAMIAIRQEIREIEEGRSDKLDNPLKHAPHTALAVTASEWKHSYSREQAAYPTSDQKQYKFWPAVARIDATYGDRNLICTCGTVEDYTK